MEVTSIHLGAGINCNRSRRIKIIGMVKTASIMTGFIHCNPSITGNGEI